MKVSPDARRLTARHRNGLWTGSLRNRWELGHARAIDWTLSRLGLSVPTLLVSGFLRSGTTWVQECLAEELPAKTVFEPLSPLEPRRRAMLAGNFADRPDAMHGAIPGPWSDDDPVWRHLNLACQSRFGSRFSMTCRRSRSESLRRCVIVKDVRLQFNLLRFHRRFGVPVLHVSRDPVAVVASLRRAEWGWSFDHVSLDDLLPHDVEVWSRQTASREEVVARCDRDGLSRIAALWAVTERFVSFDLDGRSWAKRVRYEELASTPADAFRDMCRWLGVEATNRADFARPSASCHPCAASTLNPVRAPTMPGALSTRDASEVIDIVGRLHPGWALRAKPVQA